MEAGFFWGSRRGYEFLGVVGQTGLHLCGDGIVRHIYSWKVIIYENRGKRQILGYVARYLRRPPMADYRIQGWDKDNVRFLWRDKKSRGAVREEIISIHLFILRFINQIPDKGMHSVRYFGLLTPHARECRYEAFLRLLPTPRPQRVMRLRWANSIRKISGRNPLIDSAGNRMARIGHLPPMNRKTSANS